MRSCEACGKKLAPTAHVKRRFCDDSCRKRGVGAKVAHLPASLAESGSVVAATTSVLEAVARLDPPAGRAALVLAARLDLGTDTGSAMAAMAKELRAAVADATAGVPPQADRVDDLREQREK